MFCVDTRTVDAVVRNLDIIGKSSRRILDAKKLLKHEIDWAAIRGLRNRIVHECFGLSLSVVWTIVLTDLPVLAQQLSSWSNESR